MNDPVAQYTPNPNQAKGSDDADPHVLALALYLQRQGHTPVVVTQESNKPYPQIALNVAAGALNLPSVHLYAMLLMNKIWTDDMKNP